MRDQPEVLIVDDDPAVRDSLMEMLRSAGMSSTAHDSGAAFLRARPFRNAACVLLDLRMPGMSGIDVLAELRTCGESIPVVVLTGHGDVPTAVHAMKLGAMDLLEKPFDAAPLLDTVRVALARSAAVAEQATHRSKAINRLTRLTPREREVFALVVAGDTSRQIGLKLHVSKKTVDSHRVHIMKKTGAESVAELVRVAVEGGIGVRGQGVEGAHA